MQCDRIIDHSYAPQRCVTRQLAWPEHALVTWPWTGVSCKYACPRSYGTQLWHDDGLTSVTAGAALSSRSQTEGLEHNSDKSANIDSTIGKTNSFFVCVQRETQNSV